MTTTKLKEKHSLDSTVESLATVEGILDKICYEYKIKEEITGNILVAITEAVNNAIHHGNKLHPDKKVILEYVLSDKELNFTIQDMGEGFDYQNIPDPTDPENLYKPEGRGVFLMQNLSDEVSFEDNGRKVKLRFNFDSSL